MIGQGVFNHRTKMKMQCCPALLMQVLHMHT